jgi:hypothetical protein
VTWQDVKGTQVICGTYEEAVKMMGDLNFLSALMNFPKEAINDETLELLKPYFAAPDFNFESAKKVRNLLPGTRRRMSRCSCRPRKSVHVFPQLVTVGEQVSGQDCRDLGWKLLDYINPVQGINMTLDN